MSFEIFYDAQPLDFLKKLDKHFAKRIADKLDSLLLPDNPVPHSAKAIVGKHGVFRLRIGDYRALYSVDYKMEKIIIFKIDKRDAVYD